MSSFSNNAPSTLTGKAVASLVPPGQCQFNEEFQSVKLLDRFQVSPTSSVLRFSLPDQSQPLNLSTCACILAKAKTANAPEAVIRPYTPISTNHQVGSFDLLVKNYEDKGTMSKHLCQDMVVGDSVDFKHIDFNVKIQAPFPHKRVAMIVGGTGLTPMIQALHAILGSDAPVAQESVAMLYGSRDSSDILGKDLLDVWAKEHADKLSVTHVLSHEPEDSDWKGERGFITREHIEKHFPGPEEEDIIIFVCGPPPMYNVFCGPRDEKEITGILGEMGYKPEQVYKF